MHVLKLKPIKNASEMYCDVCGDALGEDNDELYVCVPCEWSICHACVATKYAGESQGESPKTNDNKHGVRKLPTIRRSDKIKRKKIRPQKGSTFGGFVTQGSTTAYPAQSQIKQPSPPNRSRSTLHLSGDGKLRHKFMLKQSQTVRYGTTHKFLIRKSQTVRYGTTTSNTKRSVHENKKVNGVKTIQKNKNKKLNKLNKYGRCKESDHSRFRKWSKQERESKWQIDPSDTILQNLMERIDQAAHQRMKPTMKSFDGSPMTQIEFKQVSYVELGVKLTNVELDCIFSSFDHDDSGTVDYREVVHALFSDVSGSKSRSNLTMHM